MLKIQERFLTIHFIASRLFIYFISMNMLQYNSSQGDLVQFAILIAALILKLAHLKNVKNQGICFSLKHN